MKRIDTLDIPDDFLNLELPEEAFESSVSRDMSKKSLNLPQDQDDELQSSIK